MFSSAEDKLFMCLEKGTHWFQRRFHRTNFWLAKWYATVDAFFIFCGALLLNRNGTLSAIDIVVMPVFLLLAFLFANYYWKVEEHKAFLRLAKGERNPRRISRDSMMVRFFFLSLTIIEVISFVPMLLRIATNGPLLLLIAALILFLLLLLAMPTPFFYLIACDPLPPSEERPREESKRGKLVPTTS